MTNFNKEFFSERIKSIKSLDDVSYIKYLLFKTLKESGKPDDIIYLKELFNNICNNENSPRNEHRNILTNIVNDHL